MIVHLDSSPPNMVQSLHTHRDVHYCMKSQQDTESICVRVCVVDYYFSRKPSRVMTSITKLPNCPCCTFKPSIIPTSPPLTYTHLNSFKLKATGEKKREEPRRKFLTAEQSGQSSENDVCVCVRVCSYTLVITAPLTPTQKVKLIHQLSSSLHTRS